MRPLADARKPALRRAAALASLVGLWGCPEESRPQVRSAPPMAAAPRDSGSEMGDPIPGKLVIRSPRELTPEWVTAVLGDRAEVDVLCLPATQGDGGLGAACRIKMSRKDGPTDLAWTTQMRDLLRGQPGADSVELYTLPR